MPSTSNTIESLNDRLNRKTPRFNTFGDRCTGFARRSCRSVVLILAANKKVTALSTIQPSRLCQLSPNKACHIRSRMTLSKGRLLIRDISSRVGGNSSIFFLEPRFCRKFTHRNHLGELANDLALPRRSEPRGAAMNNPQKHGPSRGAVALSSHWSRWHRFSGCLQIQLSHHNRN
jgi:hypothetical protein